MRLCTSGWWRTREHGVDLRHDTLVGGHAADDLLLREPDPERRVVLLCSLGAVDFLRDTLDLSRSCARRLPHVAELVKSPDVEPDLLPKVVFVLDQKFEGPLAEMHDRG